MNRFASFIHWFNRFLEPGRGQHCAEFTGGIDPDCYPGAAGNGLVINTPDIGRSVGRFADPDLVGIARYAKHTSANDNIVASGGQIETGIHAKGDIVIAGCVSVKGLETQCGIIVAAGVGIERIKTVRRVIVAC